MKRVVVANVLCIFFASPLLAIIYSASLDERELYVFEKTREGLLAAIELLDTGIMDLEKRNIPSEKINKIKSGRAKAFKDLKKFTGFIVQFKKHKAIQTALINAVSLKECIRSLPGTYENHVYVLNELMDRIDVLITGSGELNSEILAFSVLEDWSENDDFKLDEFDENESFDIEVDTTCLEPASNY